MLVLLAALFFTHGHHNAAFALPPLRCAGPRVVRPWLSPVGQAHRYVTHACDLPVLGPAGVSHRVGAPRRQGSGPSLCPGPMP